MNYLRDASINGASLKNITVMSENTISQDSKEFAAAFEEKVHKNLFSFLQMNDRIDEHVQECIDVEDCWHEIARSYIQDGAKEFQQYPVVSLGWMMFIGMAMAKFWDEDWEKYSKERNFYENIKAKRGYDELDDAVIIDILKYEGEGAEKEGAVVAECASRVYGLLSHEQVEPGTEAAFGCWLSALHQLYLAGMAMELKTLGYKMTKIS